MGVQQTTLPYLQVSIGHPLEVLGMKHQKNYAQTLVTSCMKHGVKASPSDVGQIRSTLDGKPAFVHGLPSQTELRSPKPGPTRHPAFDRPEHSDGRMC